MNKTKLLIVYYSQTGHNLQMANWAKDAAEKEGAEVRVVKTKELLNHTDSDNPAWAQYLKDSKKH